MRTGVEISYGLFDVMAKEDSNLSVTNKQPFVDINQLKKELDVKKYETMELNQFVLDGSFHTFPDEPAQGEFGLWSHTMSDSAGSFAALITLTITFSENHSSLGVTFYFSQVGDWASRLNIKWYDGVGGLMLDRDFLPGRVEYFAEGQIEQYRKLVITFYGTCKPHRYLKLDAIDYGQKFTFDGEKLLSANLLEEIDPLSAEISINTLNFSIYTDDFAILDPQGIYAYLQKKQAAKVTGYMDDAKANLGTLYMDEIESNTDKVTTMKCIDLVGIMEQTSFRGGIYSNVAVGSLIVAIMASAKVPYRIDAGLSNVQLSGHLPICTHQEALQQVVFAIGAVMDCSRGDRVRIYPYPTSREGLIPYDRKVDGHSIKLKPLVTGVEVTAHSYTMGGEEQGVFNDWLEAGIHEITFGGPMYDLAVLGGEIVESNSNYAKVHVSASGTVELKGKAYNKGTQIVGTYAGDLPAGEAANILAIEDATLISISNAKAVADRIYNHYQSRYQGDGRIKLGDEAPGQLRVMGSMNQKQVVGIVESLDIDLTGGFLASMRMTGKAVTSIG